jgi:23S rRNA-/tRNA-specific pseudouridylate synthase
MPILGDSAYGSTANPLFSRGIALHARVLSFLHPVSGTPIRLVAAVPSTWKDAGILLP